MAEFGDTIFVGGEFDRRPGAGGITAPGERTVDSMALPGQPRPASIPAASSVLDHGDLAAAPLAPCPAEPLHGLHPGRFDQVETVRTRCATGGAPERSAP